MQFDEHGKQITCYECGGGLEFLATSRYCKPCHQKIKEDRVFREARAYARKLRRNNTPTYRIYEAIRERWGEDIEQLVIKTEDNAYYLPSDRMPERPVWDILAKQGK